MSGPDLSVDGLVRLLQETDPAKGKPEAGASASASDDPRQRAEALIQFLDGIEQAGWADFARRGRVVARDLLDALDALEAERSARLAVTADRDRWRDDRWREAHNTAWPA